MAEETTVTSPAASSTTPSSTPAPTSTPTSAAANTAPASSASSAEAALERAFSSLEGESSTPNPAATETPESAATSPESAVPASTDGTQFHLPKTKEDYDRIMANARKRAVDEYRKQHGWAEGLTRDQVAEAFSIIRMMHEDREGFLREYLGEQEEELVDPEPAYVGPDGKKFYNDADIRTLLQNQEKRLMRQMKPALTAAEKAEQAERVAEMTKEATAVAQEAMTAIKKYPHYKRLEPAIVKKLSSLDPAYRRRIGSVAALHMAYQIARSELEPVLRQEMEAEIRQAQGKQVAASTGNLKPGGGTPPPPRLKDGDVDGLAKRMEEMANAGVGQ